MKGNVINALFTMFTKEDNPNRLLTMLSVVDQYLIIEWISSGDIIYSMLPMVKYYLLYTWGIRRFKHIQHFLRKEILSILTDLTHKQMVILWNNIYIIHIMVIISQCIGISNNYIIHFEYIHIICHYMFQKHLGSQVLETSSTKSYQI